MVLIKAKLDKNKKVKIPDKIKERIIFIDQDVIKSKNKYVRLKGEK